MPGCFGISYWDRLFTYYKISSNKACFYKGGGGANNGIRMDLAIVSGLCVLTVYAEFFSLFTNVSGMAFTFVILACFTIFIFLRKEVLFSVRKFFSKDMSARIAIIIIVAIPVLILAGQPASHYDTDLYHAQSIRWIEEYGIAPGLGNLHHRLAYNSAFSSLQALFSWRFILGRSLHCVNGFLFLFFISYAICTAKVFKYKKFFVSDFLRIVMIAYFNYSFPISSPETDHFALGLVIYIFIKWTELWEEKNEEVENYALLCLFSLLAVSVKLSAGMMVLLTIYPAYKMIISRNCKLVFKYIIIGVIIIAPFLIRNIIISGYLIYPYPEIDLFNFDWKMTPESLLHDRHEISAWGRGLNDVNRYEAGFSEWFPGWYENMSKTLQRMLLLNIPAALAGIAAGIWNAARKRDINFIVIVCTVIASTYLWFKGAPLLRYGMCYVIMLPLFIIGYIVVILQEKRKFYTVSMVVLVAAGSYLMQPVISAGVNSECGEFSYSQDYNVHECIKQTVEGFEFYYPVSGDQTGYHSFPATPYKACLEMIEMRGTSFKDGFKLKGGN